MKQKNKILIALLIILNVLFIIYYVALAFYGRPHYDDLHFLWELKRMSISDYVSDMYFTRSGRFVGYFINGLVFKTILLIGSSWYLPILFGIIGVLLTLVGLKRILHFEYTIINVSVIILFYNLFILTNIDFPVFFWLCAMSYYLLAPALIFLLGEIFSDKKGLKNWISVILLSLFLGGGQEAFTPIVMFCLFILFWKIWKEYNYDIKNVIKSIRIKKIIVAELIMFVSFIIVLIAPGNYNRLGGSDFHCPNSVVGCLGGFAQAVSLFIYFVSFYFPYYFVLAIVAYVAFGTRVKQLVVGKTKYIFVSSVVIYLIYLLLSVLPSVFLWGGFGIQRNYTHIVFVTMFIFSFWIILFLNEISVSRLKILNILQKTGMIILIIIMCVNLFIDIPVAKQYAKSVDDRIVYLLELKKEKHIAKVEVAPLKIPYTKDVKWIVLNILRVKNNPKPILYYISDAGFIPNEYSNYLSKLYGFNFKILLKKE